jgi:hypothetical protein
VSEPTNRDRCHGGTVYDACERREACGRYDAKPRRDVFYLHPQVPGPCIYYRPRREAPSDRREEVQSPLNPLSPSPPGDPA